MPALVANVISFSVGATNSFVLNTVITFHDRKAEPALSPQRALRFASVTLGCLALSSAPFSSPSRLAGSICEGRLNLATFAAGYIFNDRIVFKAGKGQGN